LLPKSEAVLVTAASLPLLVMVVLAVAAAAVPAGLLEAASAAELPASSLLRGLLFAVLLPGVVALFHLSSEVGCMRSLMALLMPPTSSSTSCAACCISLEAASISARVTDMACGASSSQQQQQQHLGTLLS
jgi:hypothetical protein